MPSEKTCGRCTDNESRLGPPRRLVVSLVVLVVCVALALLSCESYSGTHSSTDDACVDGRIHTVTGTISGTDHQLVKKGDLLVEIDPVDYDVRVERPQKQL